MEVCTLHACMHVWTFMCVARETSVGTFFFCCLSFSVIIVLSATALLLTIGGIELVFFLWGEVVWS